MLRAVQVKKLRFFKPWMTGPPAGYKQLVAALERLGYAAHARVGTDDKVVHLRVSCLPSDIEACRPSAQQMHRARPRMPWWEHPSTLAKPAAEEEEAPPAAPEPPPPSGPADGEVVETLQLGGGGAGGGGGAASSPSAAPAEAVVVEQPPVAQETVIEPPLAEQPPPP